MEIIHRKCFTLGNQCNGQVTIRAPVTKCWDKSLVRMDSGENRRMSLETICINKYFKYFCYKGKQRYRKMRSTKIP